MTVNSMHTIERTLFLASAGLARYIKACRHWVYGCVIASVLALPALAEDEAPEEGEEANPAPAIYIPLEPQFVVNYGGPGKLKYMKTKVTLRLADSAAADAVRHHLPFIRNNLVMLFAAQTDETLEAQDGRESMRAAALAEVRDLLFREDGIPTESVVDVLFNSLTWH